MYRSELGYSGRKTQRQTLCEDSSCGSYMLKVVTVRSTGKQQDKMPCNADRCLTILATLQIAKKKEHIAQQVFFQHR